MTSVVHFVPIWLKVGPRLALNWHKLAQVGSKTAQTAIKAAQVSAKSTQVGSRLVPRRPKLARY